MDERKPRHSLQRVWSGCIQGNACSDKLTDHSRRCPPLQVISRGTVRGQSEDSGNWRFTKTWRYKFHKLTTAEISGKPPKNHSVGTPNNPDSKAGGGGKIGGTISSQNTI